jgi:nucleotide-binding universal stress UspA family protein
VSTTFKNSEGRIVVGVDGSIWSYAALHWAAVEAASSGKPVEAVTVGCQLELDDALHRDRHGKPIESSVVPFGDPAKALLRTVGVNDILVLGNSGRGRIQDAFLGTVAAECVRRSSCPVTVVTPTAALHFAPKIRNHVVVSESSTVSSELAAVS